MSIAVATVAAFLLAALHAGDWLLKLLLIGVSVVALR
jgi:hypothetical protein